MFVLAPLTFPDGRLPSARWRPIVPIMIAFILISSAYHAVQPGDFETPGIPNPLGIRHLRVSPGMAVVVDFLSLFSWFAPMVVAATGLLTRYRRAGSEERQQLKWFAFGVLLLIVSSIINQATRAVELPSAVRGLLLALPFSAMWLAIAIAILRYRLYDIDVIIRKTLIYSILTAVLVAAYFAGVVLLQRLFQVVTGREQSQLVIVLSTLAIAALFQPLRRRVQLFIDRRFYRQRYNAQRTVERFARTARDAVELEPVTAALLAAVEETLQPHSLTIWLKNSEDA